MTQTAKPSHEVSENVRDAIQLLLSADYQIYKDGSWAVRTGNRSWSWQRGMHVN